MPIQREKGEIRGKFYIKNIEHNKIYVLRTMLSWAIPWLPCCADGDTGVPFFSLADDDGTASLLLEQPIECAPPDARRPSEARQYKSGGANVIRGWAMPRTVT